MEQAKTRIAKIRSYAKAHKKTTAAILIILLVGGYYEYRSLTSTATETRYVTALVTKGTIVSSIQGTGQISASNQIELKTKASGDLLYLAPNLEGKKVKAGTLIASLDTTAAEKSVRDAQVGLESAQLSLAKIEQPADALTLTQAQNSLARAKENKTQAEADLAKAYEDAYTAISNTFLDLPDTMSGLNTVLFTLVQSLSANEQPIDFYTRSAGIYDTRAPSFHDASYNGYQSARTAYDANFIQYKSTPRTAATSSIDTLLDQTYATTKLASDAVTSANNLIQFYKDTLTNNNAVPKPYADTQLSTLDNFTSQMNSHLSALLSARTTINSDVTALLNAERTIQESTESLAKIQAGSDPLDIQSAQLSLQQKQNALRDAQENLANSYVRAPFDGTVGKVAVSKGDTLGNGTTIATLISDQQIAQISLNEVDAAKVAVGARATLTFDAIDGLTLTGKVASIDTIGTVSQGVVTYGVKIALDTNDARIKSGMSVNASVITQVKQDVLIVPQTAIKTRGQSSYVQVFDPHLAGSDDNAQGVASTIVPTDKTVTLGISDDTNTEVTSGLSEGDQVVVRTITAQVTTSSASTPNILSAAGVRGGAGGGGVRNVTGR